MSDCPDCGRPLAKSYEGWRDAARKLCGARVLDNAEECLDAQLDQARARITLLEAVVVAADRVAHNFAPYTEHQRHILSEYDTARAKV